MAGGMILSNDLHYKRKKYSEVMDELILEGIIDPNKHDFSPEAFRKFLKRHLLFL
jgi:hypothetical protein